MSNPKVCWQCQYYDFDKVVSCKAFPGGIPHQIASRDIIHDKVLEGQVGDFVWTSIASPFLRTAAYYTSLRGILF